MSLKRHAANCLADLSSLVLRGAGRKTYEFFLDALWERYPYNDLDRECLEMELYCPQWADPDPGDRELVERIFESYEKAKCDQSDVGNHFQPSSMWENIFRQSYGEICDSLPSRDLERFHRFLANFGSWSTPTAIEQSWLIRQSAVDRRKRRHLEQKIIAPLVRWWLRFESNGRDLSALEIPTHGNFGGVRVNGHLITPGSVFGEIYGRQLSGLVESERPVIAELGGGFGRLFYFLSRQLGAYVYVGFDLPETLCCASYYLMKSFPEKRFLLYGERDWDPNSLSEYDYLLLPSFEISKLAPESIELFVNENSLGEIEASACENYVKEICRSSKAFWHRNHEVRRFNFDGNTTSLLNREYPVPEDRFAKVFRHADLNSLVSGARMNRDSDMFCYYYRLRRQEAC